MLRHANNPQPGQERRSFRWSRFCSTAGRMYESRDFSAMPILADALEEAG